MATATTIGQICSQILKTTDGPITPSTKRRFVTDGIEPRAVPKKEGLVQLTPGQILNINIEPVTLNGGVDGYQRILTLSHARKIAAALLAGKEVPEVSLGLDNGRLFATDGQHRLVGSVIARKPIWAVIRPMTKGVRAERFVGQTFARRVSANTIVFADDNKVSAYVKDAVTARASGAAHPWATLVGMKATAQTMSPHNAFSALGRYTTGVKTPKVLANLSRERLDREFTEKIGEELAGLFLTFGTKSTNPLAFRPISINAITWAAIDILVKTGKNPGDFARWHKHMANFDWAGFAWLRTGPELSEQLVKHWNKRLSHTKKIRS